MTSMVGKLRNGPTLNTFRRCFIAQAHDIFNKIPEDIKRRGVEEGWMNVVKNAKDFLRGDEKQNDPNKNQQTKQNTPSLQFIAQNWSMGWMAWFKKHEQK